MGSKKKFFLFCFLLFYFSSKIVSWSHWYIILTTEFPYFVCALDIMILIVHFGSESPHCTNLWALLTTSRNVVYALNMMSMSLPNTHVEEGFFFSIKRIHSKLRSITPVVIKVHVILQSFVVLPWMRDTIKLV